MIENKPYPFVKTNVLDEINKNQNIKEIISQQMEKLYFWNDIYSRTNRHASNTSITKGDIFHIYPIFFIYQIFKKLDDFNEKLYLTKDECSYFIFFSRNHDEIDEVVERIIAFRQYGYKSELSKYLKSRVNSDIEEERYQIFDTRYFSILQFVNAFKVSNDRIVLNESFKTKVFEKVAKFNDLLIDNNIIYKDDFEDYKKMLYSEKSFLDFYS